MANLAVTISRANSEDELALNAEVNCKACRNVGNPSTFEAAYSRRTKQQKIPLLTTPVATSIPQTQNMS
jgi:hypothetical protein